MAVWGAAALPHPPGRAAPNDPPEEVQQGDAGEVKAQNRVQAGSDTHARQHPASHANSGRTSGKGGTGHGKAEQRGH